MPSKFYGKLHADDKTARTMPGRESINTTALHADGDVQVAMFAGHDKHPAKVSIVVRDHDTGSMGHSIYNGPIESLLKGGPVEVMRHLWENASKAERASFWKLMANKHLREEFDNGVG